MGMLETFLKILFLSNFALGYLKTNLKPFIHQAQTPQQIITGCQGIKLSNGAVQLDYYIIDSGGNKKFVTPSDSVEIHFPNQDESSENQEESSESLKIQTVKFEDICFPPPCNAPNANTCAKIENESTISEKIIGPVNWLTLSDNGPNVKSSLSDEGVSVLASTELKTSQNGEKPYQSMSSSIEISNLNGNKNEKGSSKGGKKDDREGVKPIKPKPKVEQAASKSPSKEVENPPAIATQTQSNSDNDKDKFGIHKPIIPIPIPIPVPQHPIVPLCPTCNHPHPPHPCHLFPFGGVQSNVAAVAGANSNAQGSAVIGAAGNIQAVASSSGAGQAVSSIGGGIGGGVGGGIGGGVGGGIGGGVGGGIGGGVGGGIGGGVGGGIGGGVGGGIGGGVGGGIGGGVGGGIGGGVGGGIGGGGGGGGGTCPNCGNPDCGCPGPCPICGGDCGCSPPYPVPIPHPKPPSCPIHPPCPPVECPIYPAIEIPPCDYTACDCKKEALFPSPKPNFSPWSLSALQLPKFGQIFSKSGRNLEDDEEKDDDNELLEEQKKEDKIQIERIKVRTPNPHYYASLPGAIRGSTNVIYYPSCDRRAFTQPAIINFCEGDWVN